MALSVRGVAAEWASAAGYNSMTKAIIVTTQRTGSTFLEECLESHPEVWSGGELLISGIHVRAPSFLSSSRYATKLYRFVAGGAWYPTRLMTRFFESGGRPVRIFRAMYNHIENPWTLGYLRRNSNIHILHLRRQNLLKMYVSKLLLSRKRVEAWQPHATTPVPVVSTYVSPQAALIHMRRAKALYDHYEQAFAQHPRLGLVYENMIENQGLRPRVAQQVCAFLGISNHPMRSNLIKINPDNLRDMVTNYDELARVLRKTEFAELLD